MIGFETIGNATVTVFDDEPILTTDPWIYGNPYYGSWGHKYKIPKEQLENINKCKYVFLSHGHPDHIDPESFKLFENKTILIGEHYGDRIYNDLSKSFNCLKVKNNSWLDVSKNIKIKIFADWNQDSAILINLNNKDIILNLNDGNARGWSKEIKKIIKNYKNRFLLKLINWGDADMINFFDKHDHFVLPQAAQKIPCGKLYFDQMNKWYCNYAIPFSSLHRYVRSDSIKMNEFVTPLELHSENFNNINGELLPAFLMWDTDRGDYKLINPEINENELKKPEEFGDSWSDDLTNNDKSIIENYFVQFDHLKKNFGFISFKSGKSELNIKLSNRKEGIKFETPRNSLIHAIKNKIFDDILIGNFTKVQLIDVDSLYPDFTPYVAKYGDNGGARSKDELKEYFDYYRLKSADFWLEFLKIKSESIIRKKLKNHKALYNLAKNLKNKF